MASRPPAALIRALDRADLLHLLDNPAATVNVRVRDGVRHQEYGCPAGRGAAHEAVPFLRILRGEDACENEDCAERRADAWNGSRLVRSLMVLLDASDLARSAQRHAKDPSKTTVPGKTGKFRTQLAKAANQIDEAHRLAADDALRAACVRVRDAVVAASQAVESAGTSPAAIATVTQRVLDEMLPAHLHGVVQLDDSPVLAGIIARGGPPRKVQEVIDCFTIGGSAPMLLLSCPRFVADYVIRYYDAGSSASLVLLTVSAADLDETHKQTISRIWDPSGRGPTADLGAAVDAARMCLEDTAAG